jgi:tetratricopeptide (TPR) repeat protein
VLEEAVDIRLDLWRALAPLAEYRRMLDCLREAEAVAERLGDQRRIGLVAVHLSHSLFSAGDPDGAVRYGQRVLSIATNLGDFDLQISANWRLGRVYYVLGDYRQVAFVGHNLVAALEGDRAREAFGNPFPVSVSARNLLVWSLAERGDFVEGITRGEEAVAIARALDQPLSLCVASATIGVPYLRKGDLDRAIILLEQGLELSRTWDIRYWFAYVASALGEAYALSGRLPEALPLLEEAVARTAAPEFRGDHALHVARLSAAYLLAERRKDALTLAERALPLARDHKERGNEAWALRLLGEIAWHRDPPHVESAQDHYGQALALAADLGMRPLVAHCHLGLGRLYGRTGKPQQARKHLATATTMYREMDMRFWLEQAEAESKELG